MSRSQFRYVNPFVFSSLYFIISALLITYSDHLILLFSGDPRAIVAIETHKGWIFILISALFMYTFILLNSKKHNYLIKDLLISKNEFEATFEQAAVGIVHHMPDEKLIRVNQKFSDILGYKKEKLLKMKFEDFISPDELERGRELDQELMAGKRLMYTTEKIYLKKDGNKLTLKLTKSIAHNGRKTPTFLIGIIEDITKQKQAERAIVESLKEKEVLLSEIHHRVLNNLTIISNLMELQVFEDDNPDLNEKLIECTLRIKAIAEIHEQLYHSESFSKLDYCDVLKKIVQGIIESMSLTCQIRLEFHCNSVLMNVNQAIPCSLIVNEVITKILKQNNASSTSVSMSINLTESNNTMLTLMILVVGLKNNVTFDPGDKKSLQENIIDGLTRQLRGTCDYEHNARQLRFTLKFRKLDIKGIASNQVF